MRPKHSIIIWQICNIYYDFYEINRWPIRRSLTFVCMKYTRNSAYRIYRALLLKRIFRKNRVNCCIFARLNCDVHTNMAMRLTMRSWKKGLGSSSLTLSRVDSFVIEFQASRINESERRRYEQTLPQITFNRIQSILIWGTFVTSSIFFSSVWLTNKMDEFIRWLTLFYGNVRSYRKSR